MWYFKPRLLSALLAAVIVAGCGPQKSGHDPAGDKAALDATAAGWEKAYNEKNADAVAALYSDDAQLLPPGAAVVSGRAAIRDYWAKDIADTGMPLTIKADDSEVGGDWAWRSGSFSGQDPSGATFTGKYIEVWQRTADGWKLHRDIWNGDAEAAPAASTTP